MSPAAQPVRDDTLDGLRGLAIVSVLLLHYLAYPVLRAEPHWATGLVRAAGSHLWAGVDLFFVLSGYLIAHGLLRQRGHPAFWRGFLARRAFRILPLYLVLLAMFVVLRAAQPAGPVGSALVGEAYPLSAYASFTQNFWLARTGSYGGDLMAATWSLAIEVQFYLLVALCVRHLNARALLLASLAVIAGSVAARALLSYPASYAYPFCRGDALFAGVAVAVLWQMPQADAIRAAVRRHALPLAAACAALYLAAALRAPAAGGTWNHLAFACAFAGLLVLALSLPPAATALLRARGLAWLGRASYGIYLFHYGLLTAVFFALRGHEPMIGGAGDAAVVLFALAACLSLVALLHRGVELPMIRLGRVLAVPKGRPADPAVAAEQVPR